MNHKEVIRKWLWYFSFPAAAVLLFKLYDNLGDALGLIGRLIDIMSPFVGGFVLAFFLYVPSRWLEERFLRLEGKAWPKMARPLSIFLTYLLFLGLLTAVFTLVIPILINGLTDLIGAMPDYLRRAQVFPARRRRTERKL